MLKKLLRKILFYIEAEILSKTAKIRLFSYPKNSFIQLQISK